MANLFPRLLHPAYRHWQNQPAEMFGFWLWTGAEDLRETVRRTGANATSLHLPLHLLKDERARYGVRPLPAPVQISTPRTVEVEFDAPTGLSQVSLLVTTSNSRAEAQAHLFAVKPPLAKMPLARAQTEPRRQPHLVLKPATSLPPGRYRLHLQVGRSHAHVWLGIASDESTLVRFSGTTLRGWGVDGEWRDGQGEVKRLVRSSKHDTPAPLGTSPFVTLARLNVGAGVGIGEHNNAFFVTYPNWFWEMHPRSAMRDRDGNIIRAGDNPWIAMDDAVLADATIRQMREAVPLLKKQRRVRYWVIGGEQSYPDYLGLPEGDFRPDFLTHYRAWLRMKGLQESEDVVLWRRFRESAMTERFALYTITLRTLDTTRPIFIPTHGNPFALDFRAKMCFPIADLAGCGDGFEAGPISIDDDAERLHRLTLDMQTSFGVLVVAPRLANKRLDPNAHGGGRSFSPASLRRTVYEAVGMGVWHIGLVQWSGFLPDGEWGIKDTPAEAECRRLFAELRQASPWLEGCSRLHPQVGIYLSDATWRRWWQDRWTLLFDLACSRGWNTLFVQDAQCNADLVKEVPVLISVDNPTLTPNAHRALSEYLQAGGKVLAVGALAEQVEGSTYLSPPEEWLIRLPDNVPGSSLTVIHQTSTDRGAATWSAKVRPLPFTQMEEQVERIALLRPVVVSDAESKGWANRVECLPLTDGVNLLVVLLNRAEHHREVLLTLSPRLLRSKEADYHLRDAIGGQVLSSALSAHVVLPPSGTRLLVFEKIVPSAQCEQEIENAERCVARWRKMGVDTSGFEKCLQSAHHHLAAQRLGKAFALARNISESLAVVACAHRDGNALRVLATAWQANGKPAEGAQVRLRVVPGAFQWRKMKSDGKGAFSLILREEDLPRIYDPMEAKYVVPTQGLALILEVRLGSWHGGCRLYLS